MTNYETIYDEASRENSPGIGRGNFPAGITAVVAAAKREALTDLLVQFPSHGLLGFKAVIEQRLSEVQATQ
ncbi:hypothetical protein E3T43_07400 [Cryobacterium sp. Hh7]|uniref:hypothetical protein n=1 Tax=Cryobacterium sp. Hh7 TaxID=1259159 RepID=UPI00106985D8|nr:hypothetical protein [Cryobacterium sp. Hh7]TFD58063.1 hypothetical protein E3T43_07400 [Cryobacterium sp. Hh7]